ncbi:hypothetical protein ACIPPS_14565 [Streptomyces sp. NPDC090127]
MAHRRAAGPAASGTPAIPAAPTTRALPARDARSTARSLTQRPSLHP